MQEMEQTAKRRRKRKSRQWKKEEPSRLTKSKTRSRSLFRSLLSTSLLLLFPPLWEIIIIKIILITRSRGPPNKKTCSIKQVLLFWPNLMVSGCPERENLMFFQHFYLLCYLLQFENTRKNWKSLQGEHKRLTLTIQNSTLIYTCT